MTAPNFSGPTSVVALVDDSGKPATGANSIPVQGNVASGVTDAGRPVKIGGVFNTTPPTVTNGQRVDLQTSNRGNQLIEGAIAHGSDVSAVRPVLIGGMDRNSVTGRRVAVGVFGDVYTEGGSATARLVSAANSVNATLIKNTNAKVFTITGYNAAAALRYLKLYNKATAPTVGTDTPVFTYALPATAAFQFTIPGGYQFSTGLGFGLTVNAADADTTAVTAGDITVLHINYT